MRLFAALLILTAAAPATARRPILLESHVGDPPQDTRFYVEFLARAMGDKELLASVELGRLIEQRVSRDPGAAVSSTELNQLVLEGRRQFIEGQFAQSITTLQRARRRLLGATALVASDQNLRNALHTTLLFLANGLMRSNQEDQATLQVSEVIRSFPDRELSLVQYSPTLVKFYKKVRRDLDRQARGSITVNTRPAGCLVFVNERYVGLSPTRVPDLYPGRYRVYIQRPQQRGRLHSVTVDGNDAALDVDFQLDRVLRTREFVGFRFPDVKTMEREEVAHAASVARAVDAPLALVVGFRQHQGRRVLMGMVVSKDTARPVRTGMVALEPAAPSAATLRRLGEFLLLGKEGNGLIMPGETQPVVPAAGGGTSAITVLKWVGLGLSIATLAAGITLWALDGHGTCDASLPGDRCKESYNTLAPGIGLTATGAALAVGTGVLFWLDARAPRKERSALTVSPAVARGGGLVTARWTF